MEEFLAKNSANGECIVLVINDGYVPFLRNFLYHLRKHSMFPVAVFALDEEAHAAVTKDVKLDCYLYKSAKLTPQNAASAFNGAGWKPIVFSKLEVINAVIQAGYTIYYFDVDIVLRGKFETLRKMWKPGHELAFQSDCPTTFHKICSGVVFARPTPFAKQILSINYAAIPRFIGDQFYLWDKLKRMAPTYRCKIYRFNMYHCPTGHFWRQNRAQCLRKPALLVHYNYVKGKQAKISWMRKDKCWHV